MIAKYKSLFSRSEEIIFSVLLLLAFAIFLLEVRSLYSTPIADSYLWWGDETWLMLEFRNQMLHGVFSHPYALGSSLLHGNGIIFGNMWATAFCYGFPAALISPARMDIVLVGRSITALFAFTLLIVLYEIVRQRTSDRLLALFSVLLLLTSRSFLLTSHSARYDILSALAILIGLYLLFRDSSAKKSFRYSIIIGAITAATFLVSVHVTLALSLAALFTVIVRSRKKWMRSCFAFLAGFVLFALVLIAIAAFTGQMTVLGSSSKGAFALNLHDIPVLRLYSRSVQFANLAQRWNEFQTYALGFIVVFAAIAMLAIIQWIRIRGRFAVPLSVATIFMVLISWLECESSAPTSYLIYVLPILSFSAALSLNKLFKESSRMWVIAFAGIVLGIFAFRDMPGAYGKGYQIMTDNSLAVGAALDAIEQPDDTIATLRPKDSSHRPLVLAYSPAVHEVLRDTNVQLMTTQFIEYPATNASVDSVLRNAGVNFVLLYASAIKPDYMREVGPIRAAMARIATPIWERSGYFTDIGRSYFDTILGAPDTLRLYRMNKTQ